MNQFKEKLFSSELILDYIKDDSNKKRFLIYIAFRFLAFAGENDSTLPARIKENFSCPFTTDAFSVIENYLMEDYYFSPSLKQGSYEPLYLYAAISMINTAYPSDATFFETQIAVYSPVATNLSYQDENLQLSSLLKTSTDFYAALYLATVRHENMLVSLLPKFLDAYKESYHFTCEDYILFDFMDEYFEQKHCIRNASFVELIDTLVTSTLAYYDTDFHTLMKTDAIQALSGTASRFAGTKRISSVILSSTIDSNSACKMLAECFRYAVIYELRNNLFDFHLEDDKLITLTNWKHHLRWHYVQYTHVYDLALDSFYVSMLSHELLKTQFTNNLF